MKVVFLVWCHPLSMKFWMLETVGVFRIDTLDFGCIVQYS